jgi:hypothetical protein
MKKLLHVLVFMSMALAACGVAPISIPPSFATATANANASITASETAVVSAIATEVPTASQTPLPLPTSTPILTSTPSVLVDGIGPTNFPADVNPLTGLQVANPALLQRRPLLVKVSNLPRNVRPQWGLSLADIVFEYYTEEGTTRFAALFYGNDASMVGPIRSGRFIDGHLVRGYKAVFAFVGAYKAEMDRYLSSEYADRLVTEKPGGPITRYEPNGNNHAVVNTADLSAYATTKGSNGKQDLNGMFFKITAPAGGQPVTQAIVRYSGAIYDRWDYDPSSARYLRSSDTVDAVNGIPSEQYAPLTDRLTNKPVAFDNLVVLYVTHELYSPNIYDILFSGTGDAYAFRDGQAYHVTWHRNDSDIVSLTNLDGSSFALKPGTTFFQVIGKGSNLTQTDQSWRFTHLMP